MTKVTISHGDANRVHTAISLAMQDIITKSHISNSDEDVEYRSIRAKHAVERICATLGIEIVGPHFSKISELSE